MTTEALFDLCFEVGCLVLTFNWLLDQWFRSGWWWGLAKCVSLFGIWTPLFIQFPKLISSHASAVSVVFFYQKKTILVDANGEWALRSRDTEQFEEIISSEKKCCVICRGSSLVFTVFFTTLFPGGRLLLGFWVAVGPSGPYLTSVGPPSHQTCLEHW